MKVVSQKILNPAIACRLVLLALSGMFPNAPLLAQSSQPSLNEEKIIQRVKDAVLRELRESDFLKKEVQRGIQEYIDKRRKANIAARAAKLRLANEKAKKVRRVSVTRDHIRGAPNAPISLIEYSDFECPFCKRFHLTAKKILEAYPGQVNWVYRHFPLQFHNPGAQRQAEGSECASEMGGNEAFWKFTDAIYSRTRSGGKGFPISELVPLAIEIGLDREKFRLCLESSKHTDRVNQDLAEGARIGVSGTPTTIILNNKTGDVRIKTGAKPIAEFKADIEKMMN